MSRSTCQLLKGMAPEGWRWVPHPPSDPPPTPPPPPPPPLPPPPTDPTVDWSLGPGRLWEGRWWFEGCEWWWLVNIGWIRAVPPPPYP